MDTLNSISESVNELCKLQSVSASFGNTLTRNFDIVQVSTKENLNIFADYSEFKSLVNTMSSLPPHEIEHGNSDVILSVESSCAKTSDMRVLNITKKVIDPSIAYFLLPEMCEIKLSYIPNNPLCLKYEITQEETKSDSEDSDEGRYINHNKYRR